MPGFANMVQASSAAPPMETSSHHGVCAAGVSAMKHAANGGRARARTARPWWRPASCRRACSSARASQPRGYDTDFDAHFLRWMLSDGAGAWLLADRAARRRRVARSSSGSTPRSFTGDYPVCMQVGLSARQARQVLPRLPVARRGRARRRLRAAPGHPPAAATCSTSASTSTPAWCAPAGSTRGASTISCATTRRSSSPAWCDDLMERAGLRDAARALVQQPEEPRQHRRGFDLRDARRLPARARAARSPASRSCASCPSPAASPSRYLMFDAW